MGGLGGSFWVGSGVALVCQSNGRPAAAMCLHQHERESGLGRARIGREGGSEVGKTKTVVSSLRVLS